MAKKSRIGTCVYCGSSGPITRDHVFPKVVFVEQPQDNITVAACLACNQQKSRGDLDLGAAIVIEAGTAHHSDYNRSLVKFIQNLERYPKRKAWMQRVLEGAKQVPSIDHDGNVIEMQIALDFNDRRIQGAQAMTARALYWREFGEVLSTEVPAFALRVPLKDSIDMVRRKSYYRSADPESRGNNTVWWFRLVQPPNGNRYDTYWLICYLNGLLYSVGTGSYAKFLQQQDRRVRQSAILDINGPPLPGFLRAPEDDDGRPLITSRRSTEDDEEFWKLHHETLLHGGGGLPDLPDGFQAGHLDGVDGNVDTDKPS